MLCAILEEWNQVQNIEEKVKFYSLIFSHIWINVCDFDQG